MPITRLTCPHCEKDVELNITSVTRSRDCPLCGRYIILQFTTKATRTKRKALLMPTVELDHPGAAPTPVRAAANARVKPEPGVKTTPAASTTVVVPKKQPAPAAAAAAPAASTPVVAQILEGTSGDRLLLDPEVKRKGNSFLLGLTLVLALIALVVAADRLHWWEKLGGTYHQIMAYISPPPPPEEKGEASQDQPPQKLPSSREVLSGPNIPIPVLPDKPATPTAAKAPSEQEKAQSAVAAFLAAKNVEERLPMIRDAPRMEERVRKYYQTHDSGPIAYKEIQPREVNPEGIMSFAFNVVLSDGEARRVVVAKSGGMASSGGDRYIIDWSSFVVYSEMTWKELMEKRPVTPTLLRVWVKPGNHFNRFFPDPATLHCMTLVDPLDKNSPPIYAYVQKGNSLGMVMDIFLRKGAGEPQPVILTVKFPSDSSNPEANQVWVDEFVAEGWLARGR